jgi:hypothetical protein
MTLEEQLMGKERNIVHQYFKREFGDKVVMVKVNPIQFKGTEITILKNGTTDVRHLDFDSEILSDLQEDGFREASALEFSIYLSGLR